MENFNRNIPLYDSDEDSVLNNVNFDFMTVGMAYVPVQEWNQTYNLNEALSRGTQFPELDKPFLGEVVW